MELTQEKKFIMKHLIMLKNYLDVVMKKIADLVVKRRTATPEEQVQINAKLDKLYDIKFTMLQQGI